MQSPLSTHMNQILESNRRRWEAQERAEQAEETQTELSDAEAEVLFVFHSISFINDVFYRLAKKKNLQRGHWTRPVSRTLYHHLQGKILNS